MSQLIGKLQTPAVEKLIAKELKKHLRKFVLKTEMERSNWEETLQDWVWSLRHNGDLERLYQAYMQIGGTTESLNVIK